MEQKKVNNKCLEKKSSKKIPIVDPKFKSAIIPKLINSIMYDGKKLLLKKLFMML